MLGCLSYSNDIILFMLLNMYFKNKEQADKGIIDCLNAHVHAVVCIGSVCV